MENWIQQKPEMVRHYIVPKTFLGELEAENEWTESREPQKLFLHTEGYKVFIDFHTLFLFGRRGTGKTAMQRMLRYEIRNKTVKQYSFVWLVEQNDAYFDLATQIRKSALADLPSLELIHLLKKKWTWLLSTSAMCSIIQADQANTDTNLEIIRRYLKNENLITSSGKITKLFAHVSSILSDELLLVADSPFKTASAIFKFTKRLFSSDFEDAQSAMSEYLLKTKKTCLVMIDTIEGYDTNDKISESVITSLIDSATSFYTKRDTDRVFIKVTLPSEIYPRLSISNQEKVAGKILFILWRHKDLISLLAKRYYFF